MKIVIGSYRKLFDQFIGSPRDVIELTVYIRLDGCVVHWPGFKSLGQPKGKVQPEDIIMLSNGKKALAIRKKLLKPKWEVRFRHNRGKT